MNDNRSVATIDSPEFIDIHPYNPLISECQIKVMYIGKNRNGSYIDKNTAIQMANSLPGCPIVGYYREEKEDFADHGDKMTIDCDGVHFSCETKPYGFVAPNAQVWFQTFVDTDEFGNEETREYMMTTGYLWTGQFEEAKSVIENGKGQSMELDPESVDGHWANDTKTEMDFFIINDALFSKLCILGDDVEPCFEGASIVAKDYSLRDSFTKSLFTMMKELKDALGQTEGGSYMPNKQEELQEKETDFTVTSAGAVITEPAGAVITEPAAKETVEEVVEEAPAARETAEVAEVEETVPAEAPAHLKQDVRIKDDFAKKEDEAPSDEKDSDSSDESDESDEVKAEDESDEEDEDKKKAKNKHSLASDEDIMAELAELREFKLNYERAQKDEVINKYHMLSDEDKADVVAHKDEYTLEQIDEKLALVYVRKNVDFSTVDGRPETEEVAEESPLLAFSLDESNIIDNAEPVDSLHEALRELFN